MSMSERTPYFVYDLPGLLFSEESFSLRIPCGEQWRSSFEIRVADGSTAAGRIFSDNHRILLASDEFEGAQSEILFGIDTRGLKPEEKIQGEILISSTCGEYTIPVSAVMTDVSGGSFDPQVRTLEDFEQLCRKSMRDGFRLFTDQAFPKILNGKNTVYLPLYKNMSRNPVTYQHLEEFLVSTGKKEPIMLSLDKQQKAVYHLDVSQKDTLYVYKNNWGWLHVSIEVEGDFLEVEKTSFTTDDFIGKVYGLEYIVHRERIGSGRVFGKIRIKTIHQELVYEVEASSRDESEIRPAAVRSRRISWLMRDYLKLRLHRLDYRTWQDTSALTVGEMLEEDPRDVLAKLYNAYLYYTHDDNAKAMESLWPIKDKDMLPETTEQEAIYLWLAKKIRLLPEESRDLIPVFRRFCREQPDNYTLLYLLQQETGAESAAPTERLQQLEDCFDAGCTSPFLYEDAWEMLTKEEALLRRLSPFLIQVLCFGQKQGLMTKGLLKRAAFLSANLKTYNGTVYRLLSRGYEDEPGDDILEAICQLLIKGEPMRRECFIWYARAVERDIRITRLYEYYMETYNAPAKEVLPLPVRMYFATNINTLGEKKRALLYASVILHREEDPTGYTNYAKHMRSYALESLRRGRIDRNYAVLYEHFFSKPENPEIASLMTRVLFVQRVTVSAEEIRQVVVCHQALQREEYYPVKNGVAYPRIYTEDACLLFEDEKHLRFSSSVTCTMEPLFQVRNIAQACMYQAVDDPGLELYLCREKAFQMDVNSRSVEDYRMAEKNPAFTDSYRRTIRRKLLEYDLAHPDRELSPDALPAKKLADYAEADSAALAQLLIRETRYEDAFYIISEYGYERIPVDLMLRLASRLIQNREYAYDEELVCLTAYVFSQGKYDEVMLRYLCLFYEGSVRSLCTLWERVRGFQLETLPLEEKILLQAMETKQFPDHETEILRSYISQPGRQDVIAEYLTYLSEYYFLGGRQTAGAVFAAIEQAIRQGDLEEDVCKLALLKHYAQSGIPSRSASGRKPSPYEMAKDLLKQMNDKGYRFEFYRDLPPRLTQAYQVEDKVFIEEQLTPDSRVILHYRLTEQNGQPGEWIREPVKHVFGGIFVKEFLLFYGETLTYYLRVMQKGAIRNTDTFEISLTGMDTSGNTRYKLLNHMLEAQDRGDIEDLRKTWKRYRGQEKAVESSLSLIRE